MNFVHFWAIGIGAAALAGPFVVHFLTKPKPVAYPLATLRFLREILEEKKARSRLRDFLVLLLRTLAIGLLAMAIARPWLDTSRSIQAVPDDAAARVLVIDVSQSMGTNIGGSTYLQRAQAIALKYLESSPSLYASVLLVGAKPKTEFPGLSNNISSLRDYVRSAVVRSESANVKAAMTQANTILQQAAGKRPELIVISDFQRSNWGNLHLDAIDASIQVQLESVSMPDANNVAITRCQPTQTAIAGSEFRVEVDVTNFSEEDVSVSVGVQLGEINKEVRGTIRKQATETWSVPVLAAEPQWLSGWVQLKNHVDSLSADDRRPLTVRVQPPPKVALIQRDNGRSEERSVNNESLLGGFYLEQALRVVLATESDPTRLKTVSLGDSPDDDWLSSDVYILHKTGAIDPVLIKKLSERLRQGKSMLYVASNLVDAMNMEQFASSLGNSFSPPVEFIESASQRSDLGVRSVRSRAAPFAAFGDQAIASFQTVQITTSLESRAKDNGLKDQVLGELSDGTAWVFRTSCDAGQVSVMNCDLDRSNWATQASFLPFVAETVQSLMAMRESQNDLLCGVPLVRTLDGLTRETKLRAETLDTKSELTTEYGKWEWSNDQSGWIWSWAEPTGPGNYALQQGSTVVQAISTVVPSIESDPKTLDASLLKGRMAGSRSIHVNDLNTPDEDKSDDWWSWLIVACILGMIAEVLTLRLFSA